MSYRYKNSLLLGHIELTEKQDKFHKIMRDPMTRVVFISGPAGTAKTFLSVYTALYKHNEDNQLNILYLRSLAESAEKGIGFLKGSMDDKFNPYMGPLEDKLDELLNRQERDQINHRNALDAAPINFLRGATWRDKVVIVDEAQNMTVKEITTVVTRISRGSTLFICGDSMQSDIRSTGFTRFCEIFDDEESKSYGIHHLGFTKEDIMRDKIISYLVDKIEKSDLNK
jgi:phosphate starvation-inducible PhoH-like protein|tara:strand:- start:169 stop:849 length:681 start_codon:yes stop_codon:yes gene_type:complete